MQRAGFPEKEQTVSHKLDGGPEEIANAVRCQREHGIVRGGLHLTRLVKISKRNTHDVEADEEINLDQNSILALRLQRCRLCDCVLGGCCCCGCQPHRLMLVALFADFVVANRSTKHKPFGTDTIEWPHTCSCLDTVRK